MSLKTMHYRDTVRFAHTKLKEFLTFSEEGKLERAVIGPMSQSRMSTWHIYENYKGFYALDYQLITNQLERTTAYKDMERHYIILMIPQMKLYFSQFLIIFVG